VGRARTRESNAMRPGVLASPFAVAIIIIVIEIIAFYRWRWMTARLPNRPRQESHPWTGSVRSSDMVVEPLSSAIAELPAQSEGRSAVSSQTFTTHTRSHSIWGTARGNKWCIPQ
jgi:hypothetical protein